MNDQPIYYFLANVRTPTKYAFPPFIMDPHFSRLANVDYRREIEDILALNPKFVLVNRDLLTDRSREILKKIERKYGIQERFGNLEIYRAIE
jgi:hypothetical protein